MQITYHLVLQHLENIRRPSALGLGLNVSSRPGNIKQHAEGITYTGKGDTGTSSGGLVHLTEDKGDLGLALELNDGGLLHFVVQIVTLTGTLTDTGEDGVTTVGLGDVVDELLDEDSLADTSATEQTNLTTTSVRSEKIDDLDTSLQNLSGGPVRRISSGSLRMSRVDDGPSGNTYDCSVKAGASA
jgi:hypothetical protein